MLLAVDGSSGSAKAVQQLLTLLDELRDKAGVDVHVVHVQRSLPGDVSHFVSESTRDDYHHERGEEALAAARQTLEKSGVQFQVHQHVGDPGSTIAALVIAARMRCAVDGCRPVFLASTLRLAGSGMSASTSSSDIMRSMT